MSRITCKQILKKVGSDKLDLAQGDGYWYFIYDDPEKNFYETETVHTYHLSNGTLEFWVEIGKDFVEKCLKNIEERALMKDEKPFRLKLVKRNH